MFTLKTLKNALRFQSEHILSLLSSVWQMKKSGGLFCMWYQHFSFNQSVSSSLEE